MGDLKNGTDEPVSRAGIETQTQRMDMATQFGGRGEWDELGDSIDVYELVA